MSRLVFMLEERSAKVLLEGLLPRIFPSLNILCISHEGKNDLQLSLPKKLRAWNVPGDEFVVVRDADGADCRLVKQELVEICNRAGRPGALIRIACRELEAWYLGQANDMAEAFDHAPLADLNAKARFRDPDNVAAPSGIIKEIWPSFQKVQAARLIASHLSYKDNRSASFRAFVEGVARLSGSALPQ